MNPQLALRVAIVGGFALAMFAVIFFRLWFLQVLNSDQYVKAASVNRVRSVPIPAPRGEIHDRNGNILVDSKSAIAVQVVAPDLPVPANAGNFARPPAADTAVYRKLAKVLQISTKRHPCRFASPTVTQPYRVIRPRLAAIPCAVAQQLTLAPYEPVAIKTDVSNDVLYYLSERQNQFPGVSVGTVYLRQYPLGKTAAQLFGTVGPLSPDEVKLARYRRLPKSSVVGQSGLEYYYDKFLRGTDGLSRVQVNALGQPVGNLRPVEPNAGHTLKLSLDLRLQKVGEQSLAQSIASNPPANSGAFVAMNPEDGEIYAMGSLPSFNPSIFTHRISDAAYTQLNSKASNYPLINRALQTAGPDGSTFKPITAIAALQSGAWSTSETYDDTGKFCLGIQCRHNAGNASYGVLDLTNAIRVSSDDFFYNLGALTNVHDPFAQPKGGALQHWASALGIGRKTGVDVGGEVTGTLPTPQWRADRNKLESECDKATGPFAGKPKHAVGGCGIADGSNRPWSVGDNASLAVGQGDVQVTPLQLADAYAAIANGGTIVRPHIGLEIDSSNGSVLQRIDPPPSRRVDINPSYLDTIRAGLRAAASQPGGTSFDVFGKFPVQVYGKTGTAQYTNQQDYSWYACFVPKTATSTPIVIVVTVAQGGFGAVAAAPVARQMLSQWFFGHKGAYVAGSSKTL